MRYLYVDNHVLADRSEWPLLQSMLAPGKELRLSVSPFNLYEIANYDDVSERQARADFVDSLNPAWCFDRLAREDMELQYFIWTRYFRLSGVPQPRPFSDSLQEVHAYREGYRPFQPRTARQWVDTTDAKRYKGHRQIAPRALNQLQAAKPRRTKSFERVVMRSWIKSKIPRQSPSGLTLSPTTKEKILDFCIENLRQLLAVCPALSVENELCFIRPNDEKRQPKESDGPDLEHVVLGLTYGDFFSCNDGFAHSCAIRVIKKLPAIKLAGPFRSLKDVPA
jgi:hypothetical protein